MEYKTITIKISDKDIKEHGSASGLLIDELAFSAGSWTENDLFENNYDYEKGSYDYVLEHFDFEGEFLKTLTKKQAREYAKNLPKFETGLAIYKGALTELIYDEEALTKKCKALADELEESREYFWKDMTKEWLYGDNGRNSNGVIDEIRKYYGAEDTTYDHKKGDSFSFIFDVEEFHEKFCGCGEEAEQCENFKTNDYKDFLVDSINIDIENAKRSNERKREEAKIERERMSKYKAEQRAEKNKDLMARLNKIK